MAAVFTSTLSQLTVSLLVLSLYISNAIVSAGREDERRVQIIYGVNAGGNMHQDIYGVVYQKDPSTQGIASDHGMRLNIDRVHPNDEILYQTERYSHSTFGYDIPIKEDGSYVLVLKFAEVYFRSPRQKVFNVALNSKHQVIEDLDIFANVGYSTAHDEYIPFTVMDGGKTLLVGSETSDIKKGKIRVDFVKGSADNPKVNAFFVVKGNIEDIPRLPPPRGMEDEEQEGEDFVYSEDDEDIQFSPSDLGNERNPHGLNYRKPGKIDVRSGPVAEDPWDFESPLVVYLPVFASLGSAAVSFYALRFISNL